jgi:hypothetical protein
MQRMLMPFHSNFYGWINSGRQTEARDIPTVTGPVRFLEKTSRLTVFLASSWARVNRLGSSYMTQGDRKIHDLPPLPPATVVQQRPRRDPTFSRLHLSRASIVSYWLERAAHSQSEWRRPIPLWQWNQPGQSYVTNNFWLFLHIQCFLILFIKKCLKTKR